MQCISAHCESRKIIEFKFHLLLFLPYYTSVISVIARIHICYH